MTEQGLSIFHLLLVLAGTLGVHALRQRIGLVWVFAAIGCLATLVALVAATGISVVFADQTFLIGSNVYYLCVFTGIFVLYLFDGPTPARTAMGAFVGVTLVMPLVSMLINAHVALGDAGSMAMFPDFEPRMMAASVSATLVNFVVMAISWEALARNRHVVPLPLRVFVSMFLALEIDALVFNAGAFYGLPFYEEVQVGTAWVRLVMAGLLSVPVTLYVMGQRRLGAEIPQRRVLAIFGGLDDLKDELDAAHVREEALKATEQRLRAILEALPVVVVAQDASGRLVHTSPEARRVFEAVGQEGAQVAEGEGGVLATWLGEHNAAALDKARTSSREGLAPGDAELQALEGSIWLSLWDMSSRAPIRGWESWFAGVDVTAARRGQVAAKARQALYQALFVDHRSPRLFVEPTTGRITAANTTAESLLGDAASFLSGHPLHTILNQPAGAVEGWMQETLLNGQALLQGEVQPRATQVQRYQAHASRLELDGQVVTFVELWDITEAHLMRREMLKRDKLEALSVLAGGLAHDFNNYLTGVRTNAQVGRFLLESDEPSELEELGDILADIDKATEGAAALTAQLMTFTRSGAPKLAIVDIKALIEDSLGFMLTGSKVTWRFGHESEDLSISGDAGQLGQVFGNLTLNARQAMNQGGCITITCAKREVTAADALPLAPGLYGHITFEDQGGGIDEAHLPRIFDPFFTTKAEGTGLGLTSCFTIIQRHEGLMTVRNTDEGACFEILLPAANTVSRFPAVTLERPSMVHRGTVLIMDDDRVVRRALRRMIRQMGYKVVEAEHGQHALDLLLGPDPVEAEVALLDLTVPGGMGGAEVAAQLRAHNLPIALVAISGYADNEAIARPEAHGFSASLAKPFNVKTLDSVLEAFRTDSMS